MRSHKNRLCELLKGSFIWENRSRCAEPEMIVQQEPAGALQVLFQALLRDRCVKLGV